MHVQIIGGPEEGVPGVDAMNDVPAEVTNISTTDDTILLESLEDDKDEVDDDF
jgi:hypothetical protein